MIEKSVSQITYEQEVDTTTRQAPVSVLLSTDKARFGRTLEALCGVDLICYS